MRLCRKQQLVWQRGANAFEDELFCVIFSVQVEISTVAILASQLLRTANNCIDMLAPSIYCKRHHTQQAHIHNLDSKVVHALINVAVAFLVANSSEPWHHELRPKILHNRSTRPRHLASTISGFD